MKTTREIKFRAWDNVNKRMGYFQPGFEWNDEYELWYLSPTEWNKRVSDVPFGDNINLMQYTGFQDKNNRDVYEGDIFRIEENDEENTVIYVVVVWVKEWAMFTTLRLEDEYPAYLLEGADAIDETMFWTYTLEDIGSPKHYPCGNIYENPELLQP